MMGKSVTIRAADGGSFTGYLATPASGTGPGLILLQEIFGINPHIREVADIYAQEGYMVLAPDLFWRIRPGIELGYSAQDFEAALGYYQRLDVDQAIRDATDAIRELRATPGCSGKVGALGFCLGGRLAYLTAARCEVDAAVSYYGVAIETSLEEAKSIRCPLLLHFAGEDKFAPAPVREAIRAALAAHDDLESYVYPGAQHAFNNWERDTYDHSAASVAHSRTLALLRRTIGPRYDLSALWDKHCEYEFTTRNVDDTMSTMVAEPYVNHVPTMTGGFGYRELARFYRNHFIPKLPTDTRIVVLSRTVGADRLVDEIMFCFTHDREIDFLLPGVPPTGKYVEIPTVAIVQFRGDKLYNEHIYWDQACALVQIGLLDPKGLPVAGAEAAKKIFDESLPSNTLMARWAESAPKSK